MAHLLGAPGGLPRAQARPLPRGLIRAPRGPGARCARAAHGFRAERRPRGSARLRCAACRRCRHHGTRAPCSQVATDMAQHRRSCTSNAHGRSAQLRRTWASTAVQMHLHEQWTWPTWHSTDVHARATHTGAVLSCSGHGQAPLFRCICTSNGHGARSIWRYNRRGRRPPVVAGLGPMGAVEPRGGRAKERGHQRRDI